MTAVFPIFDHHIHTDVRNADDYELMAVAGITKALAPCSASNERRRARASWAARFDRLIEFERERAARYGVELLVGVSVHAADIADRASAVEGVSEVAARLSRPGVRAVGELALRSFSETELDVFERQLALAADRDVPAMIESPPGLPEFERLLEILGGAIDRGVADPARVCLMDMDMAKLRLARTLRLGAYGLPASPRLDGLFCLREKLGTGDILAIIEDLGHDRLMLNSGFHVGSADPLGLAKTVLRLRLRSVDEAVLRSLAHDTAERFFDAA